MFLGGWHFEINLILSVNLFYFHQVLCEHFQLSQILEKKTQKLSGLGYKNNLGIMSPARGRQGRTFLAGVPQIMALALAGEIHPVWPMGSLHHSCPHSALTLSTFWHWFNPSFQVFSTSLALIFCFSLCPLWIRLPFFGTEMQLSSLKTMNFCPQTQKPWQRLSQQNYSRPEIHLKKEKIICPIGF